MPYTIRKLYKIKPISIGRDGDQSDDGDGGDVDVDVDVDYAENVNDQMIIQGHPTTVVRTVFSRMLSRVLLKLCMLILGCARNNFICSVILGELEYSRNFSCILGVLKRQWDVKLIH